MQRLAVAGYNLCDLLQRKAGVVGEVRIGDAGLAAFWASAPVSTWARGKLTLKRVVRGEDPRVWRREIPAKLVALPNCNSVGSLQG